MLLVISIHEPGVHGPTQVTNHQRDTVDVMHTFSDNKTTKANVYKVNIFSENSEHKMARIKGKGMNNHLLLLHIR